MEIMTELVVVLMTAGTKEEAGQIAQAVVEERLAACVNVIPGVTSYYRWQGEVQCDQEWLLVAKTRQALVNRLRKRVEALHSYDLPELITLPVTGGSEGYLAWVAGEVLE
jgi:periplasmic divalent cation tolerance protein